MNDTDIILDTGAIETVVKSEQPWKDLLQRVLIEDSRLVSDLGMHYRAGSILKHTRQQIKQCLYNNKMFKNQLYVNRWFRKVKRADGVLRAINYVKLNLKKSDKIKQFSHLDIQYYDMKTHFELKVAHQKPSGETCTTFHVVPDVKVIVEDMFNPEINGDTLGQRYFLIVYMLVNARVMNVETGLESFFSSLGSQNFSGGQKWQNLENRGAVRIHVGERCSQMQENMQQLAKLSLDGLPKWHLPKMILPITIHSGLKVPKGMRKFLVKEKNMYSRAHGKSLDYFT